MNTIPDIKAKEFFEGLFNMTFMSEEERETIYDAAELYAKGRINYEAALQNKVPVGCYVPTPTEEDYKEFCNSDKNYTSIKEQQQRLIPLYNALKAVDEWLNSEDTWTNGERIECKSGSLISRFLKATIPNSRPTECYVEVNALNEAGEYVVYERGTSKFVAWVKKTTVATEVKSMDEPMATNYKGHPLRTDTIVSFSTEALQNSPVKERKETLDYIKDLMEINNLNSIDDLLNHFKAKRENISAFITNVIKKNDYKCKPNFCMKRTIGNCDLGKCIFDSHVKDDWKGKDKYQFLYWLEDNINDDPNAKYIKAKDIQSACKIFLDKKPKSLRRVDYEVRFNDDFINISDMKEFENYF